MTGVSKYILSFIWCVQLPRKGIVGGTNMYCKKGGAEHIIRVPKAVQVIKLQRHSGSLIRYGVTATVGYQSIGTKLGYKLTN